MDSKKWETINTELNEIIADLNAIALDDIADYIDIINAKIIYKKDIDVEISDVSYRHKLIAYHLKQARILLEPLVPRPDDPPF